jgi:hypothetical protein
MSGSRQCVRSKMKFSNLRGVSAAGAMDGPGVNMQHGAITSVMRREDFRP